MDNSLTIKQITIVQRPNLDQTSCTKPKPKRREMKMTEEEKEINRKILFNMKRKMDFAKNPRYENDGQVISFSNLIYKDIKCKDNPFFVEPQEVIFRDYQTNCVYQIDLKVLNRTQLLTSFKYIPPLTENFTIKGIVYPKKDSALIAPGMFAKVEIYFHATSMENFQDEITIITEKMAFKVPIKGVRDKPALSLANPMDCKKCFIGDRVEIHFRCKNNGGDAHFRFLSEEVMNSYEDPNVSGNELLTVGPFNIFPQEFYLYKGMTQNITINFTPTEEGMIEKKLNLVCESACLNYILKGEGIKVDISIKSLDGLSIENENGKSEKLENLLFQDTYPHTSSERIMVLKNTSPVSVKFHWSIYDFHHQNDFSVSPDDNFYFITPEDGIFEPYKEIEFKIRFTPLNSVIYEQKLDLVIEDVPFPAIKQFTSNSQNIKQSFTKAEPYLPGFNSPFPSYPLYSFHLKGRGKLPFLEVNKSYIDLGDVYLNQEVIESFTVSNPKTGIITFKLKKIMQKLLLPDLLHGNANRCFKDNCLDENIIIKNKLNLIQKTTEIPVDLSDIDEYQTDLLLSDVDYLQLNTYLPNDIDFNTQAPKCLSSDSLTKSYIKKKDTTDSLLSNEDIEIMKSTINHVKKRKSLGFDETLTIKQNNTLEFCILFRPDHIGIYKSSIVFQPDDGLSFAIDIKANIIGPVLTVNTPFVDFGLFSIGKTRSLSFQIENRSPIQARYLIKETRFVRIAFSSSDLNDYIEEYEGEIDESNSQKRNKIETLIDYDTQDMIQEDIMKVDSYRIKYSSVTGVLSPNEKKDVTIYFYSPYPTHIHNTIEVMVEHSETVFFNYSARCEMASAYIKNTLIQPKDIFLTMPIVYNNNMITIVNPSNLPIHFKWDNIFEADHITAEFEPNMGVIEPHCEQNIKFKIVYFYIALIDDLFKCYIEEMDIPLGVVVQGEVIGLDIAYEYTKETFELFQSQTNLNALAKNDMGTTSNFSTTRKRNEKDNQLLGEKLKMTEINMKYLKVNAPSEITFKIKNLSGIPTNFDLAIQNYPPGKEKVIKIDKDQTTTNMTQLSKLSSIQNKKKKRQPFKIDHLLLSAAHEEINFTSAKGAEFTKMKQIVNDSVLYLSNNKGVAIVVDPKKGHLEPHSECLVKVSFFNECVGEFFDNLTSGIKGLPLKLFPINLKIKGNPLQLSPFQPGINYIVDPPLLKMGYVLRNVGQIEKHVKLQNIGANTIAINWKLYDYEAFMKPDYDVFDIKIQERTSGKFGLKFKAFEPKQFPPEENCFTISPESAVINPKSTYDFLMTFKTSEQGQKIALLVAYPRIEGDDESKVSFNELSLKVIAHGLEPNLTVDKPISFNDDYLYKFYVHSYGKSPRPMRSLILINKEKINMKIQLQLEGPFRIERTEPLEATIGKMMYNVIPNSNIKLDIKYLAPSPQNETEWPLTLVNEKTGTLTVIFENNEYKTYSLMGILKRPRIKLSMTGNESVPALNIIDFGYVNCDSRKVEYMHLMNETEVDTNWKINYVKYVRKGVYGHGTITREEKEDLSMDDNPEVFTYDLTEGIIYGPSQMLINLPLGPALPEVSVIEERRYKPMKIQVMFSPKKNMFYKCRYRITTSTGNSIDFILKGFGSYLEEHII